MHIFPLSVCRKGLQATLSRIWHSSWYLMEALQRNGQVQERIGASFWRSSTLLLSPPDDRIGSIDVGYLGPGSTEARSKPGWMCMFSSEFSSVAWAWILMRDGNKHQGGIREGFAPVLIHN